MPDHATKNWCCDKDGLLLQDYGWSGARDYSLTMKAIDCMRNRPIPVDQIIVDLSVPLQTISCSRLPIEADLNAPSAQVWMAPEDLERILILMAQFARRTLGEPARLRIHTWTSHMRQGPRKLWLRVEADAAAGFASNRTTSMSVVSIENTDSESIDFFRLRSLVEAIPAHLAEFSRAKARFEATIVFDLANEATGHGMEETSR